MAPAVFAALRSPERRRVLDGPPAARLGRLGSGPRSRVRPAHRPLVRAVCDASPWIRRGPGLDGTGAGRRKRRPGSGLHARRLARQDSPVKTFLGIAALVVAAGTVGYFAAGWGSGKAVSLGPPPRQTTSTQAAQSTALPSGRALEVWFSRGGRLVESLRTHTPTRRVATAALLALLAGPTRSERATRIGSEIPPGTQLHGVTIAKGVARVDLSADFEAGGSSRSLQLRLAQVVYTLTQFPTVSAVRFSVDGTTVNDHPVG